MMSTAKIAGTNFLVSGFFSNNLVVATAPARAIIRPARKLKTIQKRIRRDINNPLIIFGRLSFSFFWSVFSKKLSGDFSIRIWGR